MEYLHIYSGFFLHIVKFRRSPRHLQNLRRFQNIYPDLWRGMEYLHIYSEFFYTYSNFGDRLAMYKFYGDFRTYTQIAGEEWNIYISTGEFFSHSQISAIASSSTNSTAISEHIPYIPLKHIPLKHYLGLGWIYLDFLQIYRRFFYT